MIGTSNLVGVARVGGEYRTMAFGAIAAGKELLQVEGVLTERPTRLTVQVGDALHVDLPESTLEEQIDRYTWRFLNHACHPNAALRGRQLLAVRDIRAGEEITFDYETTEYELASPFRCECGARGCNGRVVRGFRHLDAARRAALLPLLAPHLRRIVDRDTADR